MIEFDGVSRWYGQVSALMDVSFRVEPGVTGLVGQNGAGKSTLMKLAAGLLRPSQGRVRIDGLDPATRACRQRIGLCPDLDRFYEEVSGVQFVAWMLRFHGAGLAESRRRAAEVLHRLGLGDAMHRPIRGYSKGMRQRVKLAQALAHEPVAVLLDEPLTGLDPVARHELSRSIVELGRSGVAVLVSSHVLHELQAVTDRVLLIHQGRLMAEGTIAELRQQLDDRPRRLLLRSRAVRELAARLAPLPVVRGMWLRESGVELSTDGGAGLFDELTAIGADADGLIDGIEPLDDSLEAVFGYLVSQT